VSAVDAEAPDAEAHAAALNAEAVDVLLGPGDVLLIPAGWWHYVRAATVSFSVNMWF
jgi:ribosomal protein L16 Arg81 hydroxylase